MKIKIFTLLFGIILISCNTKASKEREIKKTVTKFLNAVERDDKKEGRELIYNSKHFYGGINMELSFFHKNYKKINSYIDLKNNIKVKDTIYLLGQKFKYVQYHIKNSNDSLKPLMITFIFYDQVGYDKIYNCCIFNNMLDWE